jgi:hypothetical protein
MTRRKRERGPVQKAPRSAPEMIINHDLYSANTARREAEKLADVWRRDLEDQRRRDLARVGRGGRP